MYFLLFLHQLIVSFSSAHTCMIDCFHKYLMYAGGALNGSDEDWEMATEGLRSALEVFVGEQVAFTYRIFRKPEYELGLLAQDAKVEFANIAIRK